MIKNLIEKYESQQPTETQKEKVLEYEEIKEAEDEEDDGEGENGTVFKSMIQQNDKLEFNQSP